MKNTIKAALLLSVLSANVTLSYASAPSNIPEVVDILAVKSEIYDKSSDFQLKTDTVVDENGEWDPIIQYLLQSKDDVDLVNKTVLEEIDFFERALIIASRNTPNTADIAKNSALIEEMKTKLAPKLNELKQQSKEVANNKAVLIGLQKQFNDFKNEFNEFNAGTNGGIASISSMGMLSTSLNSHDMAVSAGIGHYSGAQAVAVGVTKRINSITVRAGGSYNTGGLQPIVAAAGVGYEF